MKRRNGFVSNSSSSSFVLHVDMTPEEFESDIQEIWDQAVCDDYEVSQGDISKVARFINPKEMDKLKAKAWIIEEYSKECWGANEKISIRKRGKQTYLDEALKAKVFGIAEENSIPYQVLEQLREKYGAKLTIHHLG